MYELKEETKRNIERVVGLPFETIKTLTVEEKIAHVEARTGKKLKFPTTVDSRLMSSGEPLITMGRFRTMEDVDRKLDKICFPHSLIWKIQKMFRRGKK